MTMVLLVKKGKGLPAVHYGKHDLRFLRLIAFELHTEPSLRGH